MLGLPQDLSLTFFLVCPRPGPFVTCSRTPSVILHPPQGCRPTRLQLTALLGHRGPGPPLRGRRTVHCRHPTPPHPAQEAGQGGCGAQPEPQAWQPGERESPARQDRPSPGAHCALLPGGLGPPMALAMSCHYAAVNSQVTPSCPDTPSIAVPEPQGPLTPPPLRDATRHSGVSLGSPSSRNRWGQSLL